MDDLPPTPAVFVADLAAGAGGAACLRRGWSEPEPHGTWTLGRESRLAIDWAPHWRDTTLTLRATPHLHAGCTAARLAVTANGVPVGTFSFAEPATVSCRIEPWMIGADAVLEIALQHPDAARPSAVSDASDTRELGFLIAEVALRGQTLPGTLPIPASNDAARLGRFTSLGDNSEFGLVQRRCGIDQLGPFGFAQLSIAAVTAAVESDFAALDDPDEVAVVLMPSQWLPGRRQYFVYHFGYGAAWPTAVFEGEQPAERILETERRKLGDLKRGLLQALAAASRIHVVRRTRPLDRDAVVPLWRALRRHGPNALLWVVRADDAHRPGTVVPIEPGLFQGFIDHLAPDHDPGDVSPRSWIELCRRTLALCPTI